MYLIVTQLIPRLEQVYWLDGMHGGVLYCLPSAITAEFGIEEPEVGFEEMDDPIYACEKALGFIEWAITFGGKLSLDLGVSTLEALNETQPDFIKKLQEYLLLEPSAIEMVNGTYAQAYSIITDEEYNIRAHQIGQFMLQSLVGQKSRWFVSQEFAWYPQSPQILKLLGYQGCVLRCRFKNQVLPLPYDRFFWKGLDGIQIDTIPEHTGIAAGDYTHAQFYLKSVENLAKFEDHPEYRFMVYHNLEDMTDNMSLRKEFMLVNSYSPVLGNHYTYSEMFQKTPPAQKIHEVPLTTFTAPSRNCKTLFVRAKQTERALVGLEILSTLLRTISNIIPDNDLSFTDLWKIYLQVNNHDAYAVPEHINGHYFHARESLLGPYNGPPPKYSVNHRALDFLDIIQTKMQNFMLQSVSTQIPQFLVSDPTLSSSELNVGQFLIFNPWNWAMRTPIDISLNQFPNINQLPESEKTKIQFESNDGSEMPSLYQDEKWRVLPSLKPNGFTMITIKKESEIKNEKWYQLNDTHNAIQVTTKEMRIKFDKQKGKVAHLEFLTKSSTIKNLTLQFFTFYHKRPILLKYNRIKYEWTIHESCNGILIRQNILEKVKQTFIQIGWIEYSLYPKHPYLYISTNLGKKEWMFEIRHSLYSPKITVDFPFGYSFTPKGSFQSLNYIMLAKKGKSQENSHRSRPSPLTILSCGIQFYLNIIGSLILYSASEMAPDVETIPVKFALTAGIDTESEAFQSARAFQTPFDHSIINLSECQTANLKLIEFLSNPFVQISAPELVLLNYTNFDSVNLTQTDSTIFLRIINYSSKTVTDQILLSTIQIDQIQKVDLQNNVMEEIPVQKDRHSIQVTFHPFEVSTFQIKRS